MRTGRVILAILCMLGAAAAPGCRGPTQRRYEQELDRSSEAASHAAHARRLRQLMRSLDLLVGERLPVTMDVQTPRALRAEEIASIALALADSAEQIPAAAADLSLSEPERVRFAELAGILQQQAQELGESGALLSPSEIGARVAGIRETCRDCHRELRVPGDPDGDSR